MTARIRSLKSHHDSQSEFLARLTKAKFKKKCKLKSTVMFEILVELHIHCLTSSTDCLLILCMWPSAAQSAVHSLLSTVRCPDSLSYSDSSARKQVYFGMT